MKKPISYFSCICIFKVNVMYAQPLDNGKDLKSELEADTRNLNLVYQARTVSWWDSGYGFICKYSVKNQNYMACYDTQGNYVETLIQKEWNDRVSPSLQSSFQQSQYKKNRELLGSYFHSKT